MRFSATEWFVCLLSVYMQKCDFFVFVFVCFIKCHIRHFVFNVAPTVTHWHWHFVFALTLSYMLSKFWSLKPEKIQTCKSEREKSTDFSCFLIHTFLDLWGLLLKVVLVLDSYCSRFGSSAVWTFTFRSSLIIILLTLHANFVFVGWEKITYCVHEFWQDAFAASGLLRSVKV